MSETPDRHHGELQEEGAVFENRPAGEEPSVGGGFRYVDGAWCFRDAEGVFNPRSGAGGLTADQHKSLRQLVHFLADGGPGEGFGAGPYYCETLPSADPFPTSETWWETNEKLKKICSWACTYNNNKTYATETWTVYKVDGTSPAAVAVDTISHTGVFETTRSRSITVY